MKSPTSIHTTCWWSTSKQTVSALELSAEKALHGGCWKLGDGLEVWSILYESGAELYYADCRPAFRSRYVRTILPWELVEYDEDGEAIVRGGVPGSPEIVFELQNLTELDEAVFREPHLNVAVAGIAYAARSATEPARQTQN